jgi:hypothetical protein
MTTLIIEATEYTRQDGLKMIKLASSGKWVVRKISGPAWFYSDQNSEWIIITLIATLDDVGMSFDKAMQLLNNLPELV